MVGDGNNEPQILSDEDSIEVGTPEWSISEFKNEYSIDPERIKKFKTRTNIRKSISKITLVFLVILLLLGSLLVTDTINTSAVQLGVGLVVILFLLVMLVDGTVGFFMWRMDLDKETIVLYELREALVKYDESEFGGVQSHLNRANEYLVTPSFLLHPSTKRLTNFDRKAIDSYITTINNSENQEKEIQDTFPLFIVEVAKSATKRFDSRIDTVTQSIDTTTDTDPGTLASYGQGIEDLIYGLLDRRNGILLAGITGLAGGYQYLGLAEGLALAALIITSARLFVSSN